MKEDAALRQHLSTEQIDWSPLIAPLLRTIVLEGIPDLLAFAPVAAKALARFNRAVIVTSGMVERNSIFARLLRPRAFQWYPYIMAAISVTALSPCTSGTTWRGRIISSAAAAPAKTLSSPSPLSFWKPGPGAQPVTTFGNTWVEDMMGREKAEGEIPSKNQRTARRAPVIMYVTAALVRGIIDIWDTFFIRRSGVIGSSARL